MSGRPRKPEFLHITADTVSSDVSWSSVVNAIEQGHARSKPVLSDQLLEKGENKVLSRAAWIEGLGMGVKSVTVMADNAARNLPTVQGAMLLFDGRTGQPRALIDNDVITYWKTAGDSVLGAKLLARPDSANLLVVGAGAVAKSLVRAYSEIFPGLDTIRIWNRTTSNAVKLAKSLCGERYAVEPVISLADAVAISDIVSVATLSRDPVIKGEWVQPGTHVDLIGAFTQNMREADDDLIAKGRLFVDCVETTIGHIGELTIPIANGIISTDDILGDLYDLIPNSGGRKSSEDITLYKNGGGGHLDLMVASHLLDI